MHIAIITAMRRDDYYEYVAKQIIKEADHGVLLPCYSK